jgi:hypothetical protein
MHERLVLCGGAEYKGKRTKEALRLAILGSQSNIKLRLDDISRRMVTNVPDLLTDLVESELTSSARTRRSVGEAMLASRWVAAGVGDSDLSFRSGRQTIGHRPRSLMPSPMCSPFFPTMSFILNLKNTPTRHRFKPTSAFLTVRRQRLKLTRSCCFRAAWTR